MTDRPDGQMDELSVVVEVGLVADETLPSALTAAVLQAAAKGCAEIGERLALCQEAVDSHAERETIADDTLLMFKY